MITVRKKTASPRVRARNRGPSATAAGDRVEHGSSRAGVARADWSATRIAAAPIERLIKLAV